eukprot:m.569987 g.569987  ORF g.569987 m.569987 type:complete len:535 (+) comp57845_c0_seq2:33-1637(+)
MFYSENVLAKKSPLGNVWIAAHWSKRLTQAMIAKSDVIEACEFISHPTAPLALRTSGHLLLGVVRIHDSKQKVLMSDCNSALVKIKVAFRPGAVDLPAGSTLAQFNAVTLPETLTDFDLSVPAHFAFDDLSQISASRRADITLAEDTYVSRRGHDATLGDLDGEVVPFFDITRTSASGDNEVEVGRDAPSLDTTHASVRSLGLKDAAADANRSLDARPLHDYSLEDDARPPRFESEGFGFDDLGHNTTLAAASAADSRMNLTVPELVDDIDLAAPAAATTPQQATKARQAKRRKVVVDQETILSGKFLRSALAEDGPDDITRSSFEKGRKRLSHDMPPVEYEAVRRKVRDESDLTAIFGKPFAEGWSIEWTAETLVTATAESDAIPDANTTTRSMDYPAYDDAGLEYRAGERSLDESLAQPHSRPSGAAEQANPQFDVTALPDESAQPAGASKSASQARVAGWSQRTQKMKDALQTHFEQEPSLSFKTMTTNQTRRAAAASFFEILVLKTKGFIDVAQPGAFADVTLTPTAALA